jgi:phosphate-selective porin OprO/OprP
MGRSSLLAIAFASFATAALSQEPPAAADRLNSVVNGSPVDAAAVRSIVNDVLNERDAKKKADDTANEKALVAGTSGAVPLRSYWDNGLWFASANNDWKIHLGGRVMAQNSFWSQSPDLRGPPPGNGGIQQSGLGAGVGPLDDGFFFRRVRLRSDGVGYGCVEYAFEVDFEQLNFITFDHMWIGVTDADWGTFRVGQHKVPQGLEMIGSDYHLTFLERSPLADSLWTLFAPGLYYQNEFFDKNLVFQTMLHRIQPIQAFTSDFGNGNYAETTRLTGTPIYADDGAKVLHLGGSVQWRSGDIGRTIQPGGTGSIYGDTQDVIRYRARPNMRDAVGVGAVNFLGSNANRFVDTGFLLADSATTLGPEFMMIHGPLSLRSEAGFTRLSRARSLYGGNGVAAGQDVGNPSFWGCYAEASYILTGEHYGYDRRMGMYDRIKVKNNFGYTRGEDGCKHWGWGAWQLAYRYSYLDLNDTNVNGGLLMQHEIGVNWFLNDNTKLQFLFLNAQRNVMQPAVSGTVNGFGMLAQWYF